MYGRLNIRYVICRLFIETMNESERSITPRFGREWMINPKKNVEGSARGLLSLYLPEATEKETEYLR